MNQPNSASKIPSILLIICGLAAITSLSLPLGHSRTHWNLFLENYQTFSDIISEEGEIYWDEALYFLGQGAPALAPAFLGLALVFAGLLSKTRIGTFFSTMSYLLLIALLFGSVLAMTYATWVDRESSNHPYYYLGGAIVASVIGMIEMFLYWKVLKKYRGVSDIIHILPVTLLGIGSLIAGIALWNNDQWHAIDYVVLGVALNLALVALWLRRKKPAPAS